MQRIGNHESLYLGDGFDPGARSSIRSTSPGSARGRRAFAPRRGCRPTASRRRSPAPDSRWALIANRKPTSAGETARRLNGLLGRRRQDAVHARLGACRHSDVVFGGAGVGVVRGRGVPVACRGGSVGASVPFGQIHGHTSSYNWPVGRRHLTNPLELHPDRSRRRVHAPSPASPSSRSIRASDGMGSTPGATCPERATSRPFPCGVP